MHITITQEALQHALATLQGVVDTRGIPILAHLLLEAHQDRVSITGTNLEVSLQRQVEATIRTPGAVALPARKLYEIVRALPEAPVTLKVDQDLAAHLTCHTAAFTIKGLPPEDFPKIPKAAHGEEGITLPQGALKRLLQQTVFATATEQTRYVLTSVLLEIHPEEIQMVAMDGHRLAVARTPLMAPGADEPRKALLIPRRAALQALRLLREEAEEVQLQFLPQHLLLTFGPHRLACRLIEGPFPAYERVIPQEAPYQLRIAREALQGALRRVTAVLGSGAQPTIVHLRPGSVTLAAENPEVGGGEEELDAEYNGEELTIGFDARFVLEFLDAAEGEDIVIQLQDPERPALFQSAGEEGYRYVVMPMRV